MAIKQTKGSRLLLFTPKLIYVYHGDQSLLIPSQGVRGPRASVQQVKHFQFRANFSRSKETIVQIMWHTSLFVLCLFVWRSFSQQIKKLIIRLRWWTIRSWTLRHKRTCSGPSVLPVPPRTATSKNQNEAGNWSWRVIFNWTKFTSVLKVSI